MNNENAIKISFVIPVYNAEKYIKPCLESVLGQDFEGMEIICVNDGSRDKSLKILNVYAEKYENIKVISTENKGVASARNRGLDEAKGEYVQFVDADDWICDSLAVETYTKAKNDDLDIVCFNVANFDSKTELVTENRFFPPSYWPYDCERSVLTWKNYKNMFNGNFSVVNKLYKLEFLRKNNIRFIDGINFEDHPFHLESFLKAEKIGVINRSLYFYRINTGKSFMSKMGTDKRIMDMFPVMSEHRKILESLDLFETLRVSYFEYVVGLLCNMFLTSASMFVKPRFYKKMQDYFRQIDADQDDMHTVMQSNAVIEYSDVLVCGWLIFLLKYKLIEFGQKAMAKLGSMR